ncbi:MAG TPA: preprotein translocase subunit SecY, partial [Euryarchaeota archaeon]|nr:preprotein translocase subunit SecY [Euryarchaeota archaeon]
DPRYSAYMYGHDWWQLIIRVSTYLAFMIVGSVIFSVLWVESTGMSPRDIARQIVAGGLQIPGFRTTERSIARFFERYIPAVTVLGGAIVGLLAALAQIIGTVGNVSGTGVLLAVSIAIRYSEMLAREQLAEMHPLIRRFIVGE